MSPARYRAVVTEKWIAAGAARDPGPLWDPAQSLIIVLACAPTLDAVLEPLVGEVLAGRAAVCLLAVGAILGVSGWAFHALRRVYVGRPPLRTVAFSVPVEICGSSAQVDAVLSECTSVPTREVFYGGLSRVQIRTLLLIFLMSIGGHLLLGFPREYVGVVMGATLLTMGITRCAEWRSAVVDCKGITVESYAAGRLITRWPVCFEGHSIMCDFHSGYLELRSSNATIAIDLRYIARPCAFVRSVLARIRQAEGSPSAA